MKEIQNYKDFYNHRYSSKLQGDLERIRAFHDADNRSFFWDLHRWNVLKNDIKVMDLGGGWAIHTELVSRNYKNCTPIKTDYSFVSLSHLENKLGPYYDSSISRVVCNGEKLPFCSNYFDVILFSQVLEHIPDDDLALSECYRLLKKGGVLVVAVPNCFKDMYKIFHPLERVFDESGHIHEYCFALIKEKLINNGFIVRKHRYHCFFTFWALAGIERTNFSRTIQSFLSRRANLERIVEYALAAVMYLENLLLGHFSRGSMSIEFVAIKK
jgi:ubiquinone/menaquinone biosynthesis C-methylase UbiE